MLRNKHITYILFALVCSLCLFSSCDEKKPMNTTDATVSMGEMTMAVKESKGLFYVPVVVSGEQNGEIRVKVEVKSESSNCTVDKNFILTSADIIIPANKKSVNIEIKSIDDREINDDRQFSVSIVNVNGAKVGSSNKTLVTLLDNDDIPYDRMDGEWIVTAKDDIDEGRQISWTTRLTTAIDETEEGYGSLITMSPWRMYDGETYEGVLDISHTLAFKYNAASQTATLTLKLGETMCEGIILGGENEDGYDLTNCLMRSAMPTQTSYTTTGSIVGSVSSEFDKITFNLPIVGLLYDANGTRFSLWFSYSDIVLTKK